MSKKSTKRPNPNYPFRRDPDVEEFAVEEEDKSESSDFTLVEIDGEKYLKDNFSGKGELLGPYELTFLDEEGNEFKE